ncbi:MAG: sulfotransferase [Terriglobales bacterium]|jgi:hypothetical protein
MPNKVKVLYIAGLGRSGSTILGNTLGQVEGFTHVGEFLEFWGILASGQVPCGCGVPVVACKMWNDVLREAYGGRDESLIAQMLEFRNLEARDRACLRAMTSRGVTLQRRLAKPLAELERVYRAIQRVFNCEVIVDSSKRSMYACILQLADGIDPYILHLTRDPRAAAYSFLRKRVKDGRLVWTRDINPLNASLKWNFQNSVIEVLSKRFRHRPLHLRYEDFVANPRRSLQRILNFVDETRSSLPLQEEHSLNLEAQHTVSGNPSRFVTGNVELRENHAWKNEMKRRDRMLVTAATWPLLIKYGYPLGLEASGGKELQS